MFLEKMSFLLRKNLSGGAHTGVGTAFRETPEQGKPAARIASKLATAAGNDTTTTNNNNRQGGEKVDPRGGPKPRGAT